MDEFSTGHDIASSMGNMLRVLREAGYEYRRVAGRPTPGELRDLFGELITDEKLQDASGRLFRDQHFARAVEEAFKCLNNTVKLKSRLTGQDGPALMRSAFSANSPILRLNALETQSHRDEQQGYMDIFAGSMTGVRNPRAHENELTDEEDVALELLVLANHLMRKLAATTKAD